MIPSLLTTLNQTIGAGLVTLAGLAPTPETGQRAPSVGAVATSGLVPTLTVQTGPVTAPEVGAVSLVGQIPFLLRELIIYPVLPDSTPEENDLTPTLVWQDTPLPGVGLATLQGLAPAVVGDTGQSIAIGVGSASLVGLAPTVSVPAGEEGASAPDKAEMSVVELIPTLTLELTQGTGSPQAANVVTLTGLAPSLSVRVGWTDVAAAEDPQWVDVPRF